MLLGEETPATVARTAGKGGQALPATTHPPAGGRIRELNEEPAVLTDPP